MATEKFDLIIIGSGSGNSIPDYLSSWKIALVERDVFGGTCTNRGCIPSKMFVLPADLAEDARHSSRLGVDVTFNGADWAAIRDRIFGRIDHLSASGRQYRAHGTPNVTLIEGTARFVDDKVLDVDGRHISAQHVLVAVGSRPMVPPIPGLAQSGFHTSDSIMRLDALPKRLGIIGGGYIAVEMGHVFDALGSAVTIFNRSSGLLRTQDDDISKRFTELFGRRADLHLNHVPTKVERRADGIVITCAGEEVTVDQVLVATGRSPNSDLVDAATGGINMHHSGIIGVDAHLRTNVEGVWAIGDVANDWHLKHVANAEAKVAFWNIAHPNELRTIDYKAVPAAVFSHPQVASVGLTERAARARGLDIAVGIRDYGGTAYGWALVDETSFAKVIIDKATGLVVGAHIIGPQASTLIQPLISAIQFDQPAEQVARGQYWIHPALTEVVENALLAALEEMSL